MTFLMMVASLATRTNSQIPIPFALHTCPNPKFPAMRTAIKFCAIEEQLECKQNKKSDLSNAKASAVFLNYFLFFFAFLDVFLFL